MGLPKEQGLWAARSWGRHGARRCAAGSGMQWGGPWGPPSRTETGRGRAKTESGKDEAGRRAGGLAPWPQSWAVRAEARAERRAEARGARLGRCGGEGGGRRGARAVCARSAAPGGRWPGRESWGDACCPRTLARGHGGRQARQSGGHPGWGARSLGDATVTAPAPSLQVAAGSSESRWPGGAGGRALGIPAEGWAAPPASMSHRAA